MELKPGYKTTDIGVIPSDWEAATIGEVTTFSGGSQPPRSTFKFAPAAGYVRLIQIRDYKTDEYASYIPETMARKTCRTDDIMIGRYGPPIFQILRGIEGAYNVALIKAIPNERISRDYLFNVLKQEKLFQLIDSLSRRSSGQTGVEMPALKAFSLPLPPIEEQRVISSALSDVDELLATLDHMIAKKRDLKQAAMQQLLSGETRLPGFSGEWDVKQIGEFTDCTAGGTPSTLNSAYWGGDIPWMSSGELHLKRVQDVEGRITNLGLNNSSTKIIPSRCVLIGLAGQGKTRGTVAINLIELCTNQSIAAIFPNKSFNSEYLFHNLDARYDELRELSTGDGGRGGLNLKIIKSIDIPFPSLEEQDAIASVLSDMDAELIALESRRDKAHNLKQAMMQELLTGKTRLV
ncbi:restriction endonuclease subunit S [Vibrio cholerae]|uniref:restriction endonuclease subunit S n=1 Tax=Vibrio cholerae TaxID=666 RepID=UPI0022717C8D|nr:restriction endonuclease subunit S [Vibrio cholerae]MCX9578112.1 restriction endonuclease subunit S [Vibrio cholerae]